MKRLPHDRIVYLLTLLAGLPAVVTASVFLWQGDNPSRVIWTLSLVIYGAWFGLASAARWRVIRPLQTASNLLSAVREGDFSIRARANNRENDPLDELHAEINQLGKVLREQRLNAIEATALLSTIMAEIDVAIIAFDANEKLRLANRAARRLLNLQAEQLIGQSAEKLGLTELLTGDNNHMLTTQFSGNTGRWGLRRTTFREGGLPHTLVVIADLSQALREEELKAWQRLVRVLGHELNNSLAPIKSIAGSLGTQLSRTPTPPDLHQDLRSGLEIIENRADSLTRFIQAYSRLAKIPQPALSPTPIEPLVQRILALETRIPVSNLGGPDCTIKLDAAQIEQVLINLLKNAVDAALEQKNCGRQEACVRVSWKIAAEQFELTVEDDGPGIASFNNLFVPFYTTKPHGSGIGLVLCRQIAENHGGSLILVNRPAPQNGCSAQLRLPAG
ncbi:MAG: PAS domain-containing protein [Verrucomicrobia bacterium]|nr:PAS domain-containing protein [Verrucomicrobiota bacterium]